MLRRLELGGRHPRLGRCGGGGGAVAAGLQEELDLVARRGARTNDDDAAVVGRSQRRPVDGIQHRCRRDPIRAVAAVPRLPGVL